MNNNADIMYLLESVEVHADKFPVPSHMRELVKRIRSSLNSLPTPVHHLSPLQPHKHIPDEFAKCKVCGCSEFGTNKHI